MASIPGYAGPMGLRSPIFGSPMTPPNLLGLTTDPNARRMRQLQGVGDTLTALGIGLMGQGTSTTPQSPLQGLAQGLAGAQQMSGQRAQQANQDERMDLARGQYGMEQQKFQDEQKRQALSDQYEQARKSEMEKLIVSLPPDQQSAARANPDAFWKAYAESKFPKEQGPQSAIAKAQADLKAGRMSQAEYDAFVRKETYIQPPDSVTVNTPMETAFGKAYGGAEGDAAGKLSNEIGSAAQAKLQNLDALKQAYAQLQAGGGDVNAAASLKLRATQIAQAMGMDPTQFGLPKDAGPGETINAITNQLALQMRNPSGGAGMPGAMSDADRNYLSQTVPNLDNSPQGFAAKIDISEKVAQRDAEMSTLWNSGKYEQTQEGFRKFKKDWAQYVRANPLFGQTKPNAGITPTVTTPTVAPHLKAEDGWQ